MTPGTPQASPWPSLHQLLQIQLLDAVRRKGVTWWLVVCGSCSQPPPQLLPLPQPAPPPPELARTRRGWIAQGPSLASAGRMRCSGKRRRGRRRREPAPQAGPRAGYPAAARRVPSLLVLMQHAALGEVDAVKELADILVAHQAHLRQGCAAGKCQCAAALRRPTLPSLSSALDRGPST